MKTLAYKSLPKVSSLPTPVAGLEGVTVELTSDKKAYYCTGTAWLSSSILDSEKASWDAKAKITISGTAPASPSLNDLWLEV